MIEQGIYNFLQNNTALKAILPATNSIFMGTVPESAQYPCVMFEKISGQYDTTLDGPSGYVIRRYQFTCSGKDLSTEPGSGYVSAQKLADVLRRQLNGLTGTLSDGTQLFNSILDNDLDAYATDDQTYAAIQDYFLHFAMAPAV